MISGKILIKSCFFPVSVLFNNEAIILFIYSMCDSMVGHHRLRLDCLLPAGDKSGAVGSRLHLNCFLCAGDKPEDGGSAWSNGSYPSSIFFKRNFFQVPTDQWWL